MLSRNSTVTYTCSMVCVLTLVSYTFHFITRNDTRWSPARRVNLVIVAYQRSGSTLLGEIFNNHPDVLYVFEPLVMVRGFQDVIHKPWRARSGVGGKRIISQSLRIIKKLFLCDYTDVLEMNKSPEAWMSRYFLGRSKALTSAVGCDHDVDTLRVQKCGASVLKLTKDSFEHICKSQQQTVIKTVRLHAADLLPLFKESMDMKLIYLVRDPRAIFASRKRLKKFQTDFTTQVTELCNDMTENYVNTMNVNIDKSNQLLVRYEELVTNLEESTEKILKFAGLSESKNVTRFLKNVARGKGYIFDSKSRAVPAFPALVFSTLRNDPISHIDNWKTTLSKKEVELVESRCADYIRMLGYRIVHMSRD